MELSRPPGDGEVVVELRLDPGNEIRDADETNDSLSVVLPPPAG
jgi:hypothetical protein